MLHGQQIDIAVPGNIKNMSMLTNELLFTAFKPLSVDRASQIGCLYNIHILNASAGLTQSLHKSSCRSGLLAAIRAEGRRSYRLKQDLTMGELL